MRDIFEIKGAEWGRLSKCSRAQLVRKAFEYWRSRGFPYYVLTSAEIIKEYTYLCNQKSSLLFTSSGLAGSSVALRLANCFHPQMWSVRVSRYLSPMDVFMSDQMLLAAIERSWGLWPDRYGARPSSLRRILKSFPGTASVSNFRPTISRTIVSKYTSPGATVVDFSSGYGGRMLGCLSLERDYVGIEPCHQQVQGLSAMFRSLRKLKLTKSHAHVHQGCAEDLLPTLQSNYTPLVFSSPPYYDWERYSDQSSQSFLRYPTYEKWLSGFLQPIIFESSRILEKHGHLVLNISGKERWPARSDVQGIARRSGLIFRKCASMLLTRIPYLHPRGNGAYKPELLLIFEKI
jgi:hypothetical protein